MRVSPVCYCEGGLLIVLKRNLLRQHHVANGKFAFRPKAIRNRPHAAFVQLVHIHLVSGPDAVTLAAIPSGQFEIAMVLFPAPKLGSRPRA